MENNFRLFVIGASSGGRAAIVKILRKLPKSINASFAIVVHSSIDTPSIFAKILQQNCELEILEASEGEKISRGKVYISRPDYHLFIRNDSLHLSKGPRENLFRPSIDVLFRSAAVAFSNSCVGILLTGQLNDGTSGLEAIKKCGGLAIVQNPATAEFSEMPANAHRLVNIDYVVNLEDMVQVILRIMEESMPKVLEIPKFLIRENEISMKFKSHIATDDSIGHQVPISCPSCKGPLWKMEESAVERYRCHVGHSFTREALMKSQNESLEEALWVALRTLEEKKALLERMVSDYTKSGANKLQKSYSNKVSEVSEHIFKLRDVLKIQD